MTVLQEPVQVKALSVMEIIIREGSRREEPLSGEISTLRPGWSSSLRPHSCCLSATGPTGLLLLLSVLLLVLLLLKTLPLTLRFGQLVLYQQS